MPTRKLKERFPPLPKSVAEACHLVAQFISDQPQSIRETIELAVSELATNAVLHAQTDFDLDVLVVDRSIRVAVADESQAEPEIQEQSMSRSHGRGLQIDRALSDTFGIDWHPVDGKAIWIEINT